MRIDDDEDQHSAVLWPGLRIVGAKEPVERERPKFDTEGVPRPSAWERTHSRLRTETDQSSLYIYS